MSDSEAQRPEQAAPDDSVLSEGELRAAYEAQLARIRVDDVLVETVVSVLNLAARRAGLTGAGDEEIDHDQVSLAIDATRALLPLVEGMLGPEAKQVRDALSQLQLAYARSGAAPPAASGEKDPDEGEPDPQQGDSKGPAQTSGRLWVPGQ